MNNLTSPTVQLRQTSWLYRKGIQTLAWSPDGLRLAIGRTDGNIEFWGPTGDLGRPLKQHKGLVKLVAWSSDGMYLASAGEDKSVNIWNAESLLHTPLRKHNFNVASMAWSPDGKILATGELNGAIRLWSTTSGKLRYIIRLPQGGTKHLAWTSDGSKLISVSDERIINLWHSKTGKHIRRIEDETGFTLLDSIDDATSFNLTSLHHAYLSALLANLSDSESRWSSAYSSYRSDSNESYLDFIKSQSKKLNDIQNAYKYPNLESAINQPYSKPSSFLGNFIEDYWNTLTNRSQQKNEISNDIFGSSLKNPGMFIGYDPLTDRIRYNVLSSPAKEKGRKNRASINDLAISPDDRLFATGNSDATIKIWDIETGILMQTLEGHRASVRNILWFPDGRLLYSRSSDNTFFIWRTDTWESVREIRGVPDHGTSFISLHSSQAKISELFEGKVVVQTWNFDVEQLFSSSAIIDTIHFASAKVVLVGESNVGKSCLALRLTEDDYKEQGTTHGMRVWSMSPSKLVPKAEETSDENKEIIIWDMGGQDEYRLIHQLFLHDTTVALILFDPTRGRTGFEEVEAWNLRLENQLHGRKANKLLIGTKLDHESESQSIIDHTRIEKLVSELEMKDYYPTSSKTERGIPELRLAIAESIDWASLTRVSRPILFQRIRDEIERRQKKGEVVLLYSELEESLRQDILESFDPKAVSVVIEQLSLQGLIIGTRLASGERVLVLQISEVERYAGSIIIAARNNPRGVPAIEEQMLTSVNPTLPAIKKQDRLHPFQERIVLECVVQLLLEHGICLKHEGLLIFPTLFQSSSSSDDVSLAHSVSLYYDFAGAIDNIYSSLVVRLAMSGRFGRVRLAEDKVEFERAVQGICGIRKIERRSGFAHLDLFFSEEVGSDTRDLFTVFIEEHLRKEGVNITEVLEITCTCGFQFQESSLRKRMSEGYADIICPECETRSRISEGAQKARTSEVGYDLLALKTVIDRRKEEALASVKMAFRAAPRKSSLSDPIRILHLSDLHLTPDDDPINRLQPLARDLRDLMESKEGHGISKLDYLIVSGDLTNRATAEEFEQAYQFLSTFIKYFSFTAERCIIVPGNHDLSWDVPVYEWKQKRLVNLADLKEGIFVEQGGGYLIRNDTKYHLRFENFSKFYHSLTQREYPLKADEQCIPLLFEDDGLQFITLNSAWEIDEFFPERSSINTSAISRGLTRAELEIKKAIQSKRLKKDADVTKIAITHHPIAGNEKIVNDAFLVRLRQEDVKVCLHGHVHEERAELIGAYHPSRRIQSVGAGSFGALASARPESTPKLYNYLEIARDKSKIRVHTRHMRREGGAWTGWAVWPTADSTEYKTYYDISLND